jgi:hypothetical protein
MVDMYSTPKERAKDEYWLNQERIPMTVEERNQRHLSDCILSLVESIDELIQLNKKESINLQ